MELSQKQKNAIANNIDEHIVRHIGTGADSEVYEIHRVYCSEDTHSALKIVRLDQNGVPIRCKTDAWNSVFYSPEDEPTASLLVPSSNSSSGSGSAVPSGKASRSGKSASGSASDSKGASFSYSHSSNSAGDPGSYESSSHSMGFIEEINIMRSLHGAPNVVSIEDYFLQPVDDGIIVYIRMELLTCLSDSRIFNSADDVPVREVRKLGMDICRALIYCEKVNVIHRDIKPGNIFINQFGDYLIGDFGISRPLDSFSGSDSTQGTGTISYMAPEIYSRLDYGSTIDIYSLGIVLYQMMNKGRVPFLPMPPINYTKEDLIKANGRRFRGEPLPLIASVDKGLQDIVRRACAFRPENRYASAQDFYEALSRYQFPEERSELFSSFEEEDTVNIRATSRPGKSSGLFFDDFPEEEFSPGFLSQKDREDLSRDFPMQEDHGTSRSFPSQTGREPSRDYPSQKDQKAEFFARCFSHPRFPLPEKRRKASPRPSLPPKTQAVHPRLLHGKAEAAHPRPLHARAGAVHPHPLHARAGADRPQLLHARAKADRPQLPLHRMVRAAHPQSPLLRMGEAAHPQLPLSAKTQRVPPRLPLRGKKQTAPPRLPPSAKTRTAPLKQRRKQEPERSTKRGNMKGPIKFTPGRKSRPVSSSCVPAWQPFCF